MLLAWHQAPKVAGAKKAEKLVQWQNIVASGKAAPLFVCWTNDDEERLKGLMVESIDINDTHYGRQAAIMERELEASVDRMSADKRNKLRRKLDACDMEDKATSASQEAQVTVSTEDGLPLPLFLIPRRLLFSFVVDATIHFPHYQL